MGNTESMRVNDNSIEFKTNEINFKAHVPCFARRRTKYDKEFRLLIILTGSYLFYMYIHNKVGFWSLPVDLTYVTKLVEDCQKNLE